MPLRKPWAVAGLLPFILWIGSSAVAAPGAVEPAPQAVKPKAAADGLPCSPPPTVLEEFPEPLAPKRTPSPAERDRLKALAMFSTARMLEKRGENAEALRLYERALRYDPEAAVVARQIVLLAYRMDRHAEAVRYAMKLVDLEKPDLLLLNQLAIHLTDQGEWEKALELYERAVAGSRTGETSAADVLFEMQMGRLYHLMEKYDKAADSFAVVLGALKKPETAGLDEQLKKVLLGDAAATYGLIGEAFLLADRLDEATAAFQLAHEAGADEGLLRYRLARVDFRRGDPAAALVKLQTFFKTGASSGDGMEPYRLLARILEALDRRKELIATLESLYGKQKENVPLGYALAEQYRDAAQHEKAEALYGQLIERSPTSVGYRCLAELYRKAGKVENLLDLLADAVSKTSSLDPLGDEATAIAEDQPLVKRLIETARKQHRADAGSFPFPRRLAAAIVALDAKQYDDAREFFDLAIEADPEQAVELLLTWGVELLVDEQYARASEVFRRGAERDGKEEDKAVFYFYLAAALEMDGRTDEAVAAARKAANLRPGDPRFPGRVAWVLYHGKRLQEAAEAYRALLETFDADHNSPEVRDLLRQARFILSTIAVTEKRYSEAEEWLEQILDEFPDDVGAMNDLGYLWADQNKNLLRAYPMIRTAVEKEPDNAAYRDSLGWVLYRLGRPDEAAVELEKAASLDPDPVILEHWGDVCRALGRDEKTRETWRKAAEGFQDRGETDEAARVQQKIRQLQP